MSLLEYLIKVNLALLFFLALYWLAFRKLTFFQWNRFLFTGFHCTLFHSATAQVPVRTLCVCSG